MGWECFYSDELRHPLSASSLPLSCLWHHNSHCIVLYCCALQADILVAAIGKPNFVQGDWLKPGVVVIDVGINAIPDATKKSGYVDGAV